MTVDDDILGELLVHPLRDVAVPTPDPGALLRGGRRRLRRRRLRNGLGATALAAVIGTTAVTALGSGVGWGDRIAGRSDIDLSVAASGPAASHRPAPSRTETRKQAQARLDRAVRSVLASADAPVQGRISWGEGDFVHPEGTFNAMVSVEPDPGVGLSISLFRAGQDDGRCLPQVRGQGMSETYVERCRRSLTADGGRITIRTAKDPKGRFTNASVTSLRADGVLVMVDVAGSETHYRWPHGVDLAVLQEVATSPLLVP